jgi:hypothetical protein
MSGVTTRPRQTPTNRVVEDETPLRDSSESGHDHGDSGQRAEKYQAAEPEYACSS